jgi:ketosteroid isomerase-like protein
MKKIAKFLVPLAMTILFISSITSCKETAKEMPETVTESEFNLTAAKDEIVAANNEFMALFTATDSVGLANLYTQDAKVMMNGAPAISGRESIQSAFSGIMNSGISSIDLRTIDVWGTEDLVVEEGELTLFVGDKEVDQGKYIVAWKNEEGKWKLFRDIFNSNLPAAQ